MFHIFLNTYICQARFKCFTHMLPGLTQYYCHPEWYYWSLWPVLLRSFFSVPLRQIAMSGTQFLHLFKTRQIILHCAYMSVQVNTRRDYIENDILVRVNWLINGGDSVYFFFRNFQTFAKWKTAAPFHILTRSAWRFQFCTFLETLLGGVLLINHSTGYKVEIHCGFHLPFLDG